MPALSVGRIIALIVLIVAIVLMVMAFTTGGPVAALTIALIAALSVAVLVS